MPHKGLSYPFHPTYWATEAWFWPGFVPWKIVAVQTDGSPPWYGCTPGDTFPISEPGVPVGSDKRIEYDIFPTADCLVLRMKIGLERTDGPDGYLALWTAEVWYSDGFHELLSKTQEYPQRSVESPDFTLSITIDECGEDVFVTCKFIPATYEQGGSPWD